MKSPMKNSKKIEERIRWLANLLEVGGSIRIDTNIDKRLWFRERVPMSGSGVAMNYLHFALRN